MKYSTMAGLLLEIAFFAALARPLAAQNPSPTFRVHAPGVAANTVDAVRADLRLAEERIERVLGAFHDTVSVRIFPSREGFTAALRDAWGLTETACWMVGAADDHVLYLLSPAVWGEEHVCEHDPKDDLHRRMLIAHELVHVYHGQANPSPDVGLLEDLGWFTEGLATYVSGQFESSHAARAREAVVAGSVPERLAQAWSGPYRYSVTGSMVNFIDQRWGRSILREAMSTTSQAALLTLLGVTETEFIRTWRQWVREH